MKRVLVTGAEGFVGRHLRAELGEAFVPFEGDVLDAVALTGAVRGVDAVVHLAAESSVAASWEGGFRSWRVNVDGTVNVLAAVRAERPQARALAGDPPVILADEPTAALDSHSGRAVMDVLKTLAHERDRAVVIVTHDSRMLGYADRTIRMEDGRIVSDKGARDLGFGMRDSDSDSLAEGAVA